jgi:hypothetical protein
MKGIKSVAEIEIKEEGGHLQSRKHEIGGLAKRQICIRLLTPDDK